MKRRKGIEGNGTLTRLPDGRYRIRVSLGKDAQGRRVREYVYGSTAAEAQRNATTLREAAQGAVAAPVVGAGKITLATAIQAAEDDLDVQVANGRIAASTAANYRHAFKRMEPLNQRPIRDLTATEIASFLAGLQVSGSTRRNTHIAFQRVLKNAVRNGWLTANPMVNVEAPSPKAEREVIHAEPQDVQKIVAAADEPLATGIFLLYVCGLRSGELRALRWRDVTERSVIVREGKTPAARRAIPLPAIAQKRLRDLRGEPDDFVVPSTVGTQMDARRFARQFAEARDAAGVDSRITPHSLRHGFGSRMLAEGTPVVVVAALMGHSSPTVTMDVYAHVLAQADTKAMDEVWGDVAGLFA